MSTKIKVLKEFHGVPVGAVRLVDSHTAKVLVSNGKAEYTNEDCGDCGECEDCGGNKQAAKTTTKKAKTKEKEEDQ